MSKQNWLERNWHPLCGFTYLAICVVDFIVMPCFYEWSNAQLSAMKIVELASTFKDGASQIQALQVLHSARVWSPLTLTQSGLFHVAFGAILGVGIWSSGNKGKADAISNLSGQIQTMQSTIESQTPTPTPTLPVTQ